jgi:DNA repair exonuclease SbcCD ATPase subunit
MIEKIAHLADIHIRKVPTRNDEYEKVFKNLIDSLTKQKPDRIVIVGDLVHDYLDLQGEQLILASDLLNELSKIAPVRVTRGNHDCRKKNLRRVDSVRAIVKTLHNPKVIYYGATGFYDDENIMWVVWHHGDQKNNPWKSKDGKKIDVNGSPDFTFIDLFHDPITGCKSTTGFEMKSKFYYKITDFKGQISMFGDIHRMQFLDKHQTKAYCGSLIAQDVTEGDDNFHGYMIWDVKNRVAELIPIANEYSFKNIKITPYTDFDDLDFEILNPTEFMKVRFVWGTLPNTRNRQNERKLSEYIKGKYQGITISHKNEFIESEKIEVNENVTLNNITNSAVQHEIFREYLEKIGTDKQLIEDLIALDEEIVGDITLDDVSNIEWNVIKFGGINFMSYHKLDIDWRNMDGLFQITGINTAGKTTIMKLISYILFGKTLETETRMKFGDQRFVNNRNGSSSCEGYLVLEANGEYYGIKKKTEISKNKSGDITGAPTTLSYYVLSNPDEEMDATTALEKLDEDKRVKTQQKIDTIIGSYDNFKRIVMTTSDTLNRILSNDMAVFIDSLLYDSGLDIFDKKLEGLKAYQKKANEKARVTCNIDITNAMNATLQQEITILEGDVEGLENKTIPDIQQHIQGGKTYIEVLTKKLFKIDPEIYGLKVDDVKTTIGTHNKTIGEIKARETVLMASIEPLKTTYDVERLKLLIEKKDAHKTAEYNKKLNIKNQEQSIRDEQHQIEIINGEIFNLKTSGASYKQNIFDLRNGRNCPTCGQVLGPEHQTHIDSEIKKAEKEMFRIAGEIKTKENIDKKAHQDSIDIYKDTIIAIQKEIDNDTLAMEGVLKEIGTLTNDKNDVEKRKELQTELDQIPVKIQNEELKISILQQKFDNYENSLKQIEENQKIEKGISAAKEKLSVLETEEQEKKEDVFIKKSSIANKQALIKTNNDLITVFTEQEYRDSVMNLYKKCVHRDGIPRQILTAYIIPKINLTLESILSVVPFKVWLDIDDLRPKLAYNNRPGAIIDCISASGKERTFSSVVLKFALNQINVKAKPTMFLLDEVMGKLDLEGSVEEFIDILQLIKTNMKKVLVIEQVHEIAPDYIVECELDEDGISSLKII